MEVTGQLSLPCSSENSHQGLLNRRLGRFRGCLNIQWNRKLPVFARNKSLVVQTTRTWHAVCITRSIFILKPSNFLTLPFTSMMWGLSPGACVRDITVTAETCAIDRTVAAHCQGAPSSPQPTFAMHTITISRWKPEPFFSLRSFLSMINLHTKCNVTFYNKKIHNIH